MVRSDANWINGRRREERDSRENSDCIIEILHSYVKPETSGERGCKCLTAKRREGSVTNVQRRGRAQLFGIAVTLELDLYFKGCSLNRFRIFQADLEGEQLADVGGA